MKTQDEILSLLAQGLEADRLQQGQTSLGDRKRYLGMSDLSRAITCPRAVIAAKLNPDGPGRPLETLLRLSRGHWLEYGVEAALSAIKQRYLSQVEISIDYKGVPIKAHLDLVLFDEKSTMVTVIELKSVERLPDQVYGSHEMQLYGQIGLLHQFWGKPAFRVSSGLVKKAPNPDGSECSSFPDLAKNLLGLHPAFGAGSIRINGFVLTISPKSARAFGPYRPNKQILDLLLSTGSEVWQQYENIQQGSTCLDDVKHQNGFSPLCDWCLFNRDCPKFNGASISGLDDELSRLMALKQQRSLIDDEIKEREYQLKAISALRGKSGQWINGGKHRFKVTSQAGREILDSNSLKIGLGQLKHLDMNEVQSAINAASKTSRAFERLHISHIN